MSNRKKFLQQSVLLAGGLLLSDFSWAKNYALSQKMKIDRKIRLGVIGLNGMGWANALTAIQIPGVTIAGLCEVDNAVMEKRWQEMKQKNIPTEGVIRYKDYRSLLDNKDIDVVIIGTPDHWHALMMIHACQAGKHVYVEKPAGNSIEECRRMVAAQQRYGKVVQVGQWQRSQQHFSDAIEMVHSGKLGNIRTVKVWCYQGWMRPAPVVPDSAAPPGVDYPLWLGPAPTLPFNNSRFHFHFRWFWDYAGGLMTDWGVHLLDYALLGMKATVPKSIVGLGGKFAYPELAEETPDTLTSLYEFDKFNLVWDSAMGIDNGSYGRDHGIAFIGNNGTLILNRNGWEVVEEKQSKNKVIEPMHPSTDNGVLKHWQNFIQVIESGNLTDLKCPIQAGSEVATVAQMGNISYRSGQKIYWDNTKHQFTDQSINSAYLMKTYHNGYQLPTL
jgi:predicted dehydrogenase